MVSLALLSSAILAVKAAAIQKPGVIQLDLHHTEGSSTVTRLRNNAASKISSSTEGSIWKNPGWTLELFIGTPPAPIQVFCDTGSSVLWVPENLFDTGRSKTFENLTQENTLCYLSGECLRGYNAKDNIGLNALAIAKGAEFTIDTSTKGAIRGTFGLGKNHDYDNLPWALKNSGVTASASYAIWLNGENDNTGAIAFGGVDAALFKGTLGKVKNMNAGYYDSNGQIQYPEPDGMTTALNAIRSKDEHGVVQDLVTGMAAPIGFDTGSFGFGLTKEWIQSIGWAWQCYWDDTTQAARCDHEPKKGSLVFDFSGVEVEIPIKEITDWLWNGNSRYVVNNIEQWTFDFNLLEKVDATNQALFGQKFLSWVYIVSDFDHNELAFGQPELGDITGGNLIAIDENGIPSCTEGPQYSSFTGYHGSYTTNPRISAIQTASA